MLKLGDIARRTLGVVANNHANPSIIKAKSQLVKALHELSVLKKRKIKKIWQLSYFRLLKNTMIRDPFIILKFGTENTITVGTLIMPKALMRPSMQENS
jgi:hypothetical protein